MQVVKHSDWDYYALSLSICKKKKLYAVFMVLVKIDSESRSD